MAQIGIGANNRGLAQEWGNRSRSSCVDGSAKRSILKEMYGMQSLLELSAILRARGNGIGGALPRRSASKVLVPIQNSGGQFSVGVNTPSEMREC